MSALDRRAEDAHRTRVLALLASLIAHGLLLLVWDPRPEPAPEQAVVEIALVQAGKASVDAPPVVAAPPPPTPTPPKPRPRAPKQAPAGEQVAVVSPPEPERPPEPPRVVSPPEPTPPMSFRDWQRNRTPLMPSRESVAEIAGNEGRDATNRQGRDRCDPPAVRRAEVAYLLFDTSGSMSSVMRSQALACAHQYAEATIRGGGEVVVGNFARGATFSPRTRDMVEVEAALRAASDPRATVLPTRELQPFLDQDPDAVADLVIISDGWFTGSREVMVWYRYFLELNPENRGMMYTVGNPGARESVSMLREMGFDVYMYDQLHGRAR